MIGKRQLALVLHAREKLDLTDTSFARILSVAGAERPEDLTKAGFDLALDQCTVLNFRDPRRPILSAETRRMIVELFDEIDASPFERAALLRRQGLCGEVRDLDGMGLIRLLVFLEKRDAMIGGFIERRRSVSRKQLGLLHVARQQVDLKEETYSGLLQWYGGVNTAADLDQRGFDLVMAYLRYVGFDDRGAIVPAGPDFGERPGFASAAQLGLVRELWSEWSGSQEEADLVTWLERSYHVSALRFLTSATAAGAITALKAMKRRKAELSKVTA